MSKYLFRDPQPQLRFLRAGLCLFALSALFASLPQASSAQGSADPDAGTAYRIDSIRLVFPRAHPDTPTVRELEDVTFELGLSGDGYVAPGAASRTRTLSVEKIGKSPEKRFSGGALQHVAKSLLRHINDAGLAGVWVGVHPQDIDPVSGKDLRTNRTGELRLLIQTAVVGKVRTLARGHRFDEGESVNNPAHDWILEHSPVQPGPSWVESDLLNREELNDYAYFLSRHSGRRVDLAIAPIEDAPGSVSLDYIVHEQRPVTGWIQAANTGTEQTDDWRTTIGIQNTQLTGNDDQLDFIYSTAGFDMTHYFSLRYERPFSQDRRSRLRMWGGWNEYTASEVGFAGLEFKGTVHTVGAAVVKNIRQRGPLFLDLVYGLTFENLDVDNEVVDRTAEAKFLFLQVGLEMERYTRFGNRTGGISLRFSPTSVDEEDLNTLGRTLSEDKFAILSWYYSHNFFLDHVSNREEPGTTLAHELALSIGGQTTFNKRVPPNYQQTIGGLHTVRGYPDSAISGDTVAYGTIEYRFHVPQVLGVSRELSESPFFGKPFRYKPQHPYGDTDWDLALKAFIDLGWASAADPLSFEPEETLAGGGFGFDFRYRRTLFVSVDWGFALEDTTYDYVTAGSSQVGISATIMF